MKASCVAGAWLASKVMPLMGMVPSAPFTLMRGLDPSVNDETRKPSRSTSTVPGGGIAAPL